MASFDKFGVALSSRVQVRVRLSFLFTFLTRSDPVSGDFSFIVLVSTTSMLSRPFYLTSGLAFHALQPYGALSTCPRKIRHHLCHLCLPAFQPHRTLNHHLLRLRICRGRETPVISLPSTTPSSAPVSSTSYWRRPISFFKFRGTPFNCNSFSCLYCAISCS